MDIAISDALQSLLLQKRAERAANQSRRPASFQRPAYGTEEYRAAFRSGWITDAEFEADELAWIERSRRAKAAIGNKAERPSRYDQPAPAESRQYANQMSTAAARDRRLVPEAKALLTILRARCGRGSSTKTDKTTLGRVMRRHPRSIQRYLADLIRCGYITAETLKGKGGLYCGLVVTITEAVKPFYAKAEKLAEWLMNTATPEAPELALAPRFPDRTGLSPKNNHFKNWINTAPRRAGGRRAESAFGR